MDTLFKKLEHVDTSEFILCYYSNMIAPFLIIQQTSGLIFHCSILAIANLSALMIAMLITLHLDPSIWNSSIDIEGTAHLSTTVAWKPKMFLKDYFSNFFISCIWTTSIQKKQKNLSSHF